MKRPPMAYPAHREEWLDSTPRERVKLAIGYALFGLGLLLVLFALGFAGPTP